MLREDGRKFNEERKIKITKNINIYAEGSVLIEVGNTKVICTASVTDKVPSFLRGTGKGWVTAEYSMLPRATNERNPREASKGKLTGRTVEIQRLIGRALRASIDLEKLGERLITIDCDVIQADGGTRTTSITGGYIALALAIKKLLDEEILEGKLDYIFLRPINSFWYYSLYRIDFPSLINILTGIAVQSYIIYREKIGILQILMYIVSVIMGVWFIFLFNHLTVTVAFWKEKANELTWVPEILTDFSSRPASIYPKIIRFLMIWIIPILTSINLPVDILRGKVNMMSMLWYILFLIVFTIAVYKMWYAGIKKYQSSN